MSSDDPLVDADKPFPANLGNMVARRGDMRYTVSSTITSGSATVVGLLPAGSSFGFMKYYGSTSLVFEGWIDWHRLGGSVAALELGVRLTGPSGIAADTAIAKAASSVASQPQRTSGLRSTTGDAGMYLCQPTWTSYLIANSAQMVAGYTVGIIVREVQG